jgi:hypothetical protein
MLTCKRLQSIHFGGMEGGTQIGAAAAANTATGKQCKETEGRRSHIRLGFPPHFLKERKVRQENSNKGKNKHDANRQERPTSTGTDGH